MTAMHWGGGDYRIVCDSCGESFLSKDPYGLLKET